MKLNLSIFLLLFATSSFASIAKSFDCEKQVTIEGKEGAKTLQAVENGKATELFPQGEYTFSKNAQHAMVYDSYNRAGDQKEFPRYQYNHPPGGKGEGQLKVASEGKRATCKMKLQ